MSADSFEIHFDNPQATYFSGQNVTGNVVVELLKEKRFRGIELKFLGEAKVHWTEGLGDTQYPYDNQEVYLDNSLYIIGGPNTEITLPPGKYYYPFMLILPFDIPSSFEGRSGYVRYTVKATMCRPWRFDHKCKAAFTVLNPLDLNSESALMEPARTTTEKKLCCGCWGTPITVLVSLPFTGYVSGQSCKGVFELDNPTSNGVTVKACVFQVVTFTSSCQKTSIDTKIVCQEELGYVRPRGSMTSSFNLKIPALPNSYLRNCNCIDISYILEIKGDTGMHGNLHGSVPIVIGSIPLRTQLAHITQWDPQHAPLEMNNEHSEGEYRTETGAHESSSVASALPDPFLRYHEMPPPSYEECVSVSANLRNEVDSKQIRGVTEFGPRYPVYLFTERDS